MSTMRHPWQMVCFWHSGPDSVQSCASIVGWAIEPDTLSATVAWTKYKSNMPGFGQIALILGLCSKDLKLYFTYTQAYVPMWNQFHSNPLEQIMYTLKDII